MGLELVKEDQAELFQNGEERGVRRHIRSFMPSLFIICPLPARSTNKDVKEYVRCYNSFKLRLVGAEGIPGGPIARDMLSLFSTEAVYRQRFNESGEVNIHFSSINNFARSLGCEVFAHNDRIIKILEKFSYCSIYFDVEVEEECPENYLGFGGTGEGLSRTKPYFKIKNMVNVPFINKSQQIDLFRERNKNGNAIGFDIQLNERFTDMVRENAVPIDFSVYREIKSTMEKDLYVWFCYKNKLRIGEDGVFISRKNLIEQFADDGESNERMAYSRIISSVKKIKKMYYENLNVKIVEKGSAKQKGLWLYKSPLVIKENDMRYAPLLKM